MCLDQLVDLCGERRKEPLGKQEIWRSLARSKRFRLNRTADQSSFSEEGLPQGNVKPQQCPLSHWVRFTLLRVSGWWDLSAAQLRSHNTPTAAWSGWRAGTALLGFGSE